MCMHLGPELSKGEVRVGGLEVLIDETGVPQTLHEGPVVHALGGTTRLTLLVYAASFALCVFRRVKDHHNIDLLNCSPLLKKTCVRQVVLDRWFPLNALAARKGLKGVGQLLKLYVSSSLLLLV